uniref:Crossover junction endonuclease MUS81 n=1 Tax=Albugo laibachii Nc14 TaxID=890382 RepID=F0WEQ5_9STRA|nr:crossover junction endonuclease MUS81like protein pu [Albugo laibachii Nc14]|eukprot:CCA19687.1 crossover junction endonuclease MUS81like protein pu [Albugo laibachii Nc14]
MTSEAATRKRNANRCAHASNLIIVEELQAIRKKMRPNSNLASNYQRAITSIQKFAYPIRSGSEAQCLKNIGNYMANQIQSILMRHQPAEAENSIQNAKQCDSKPISKCKSMVTDASGDKTASTCTRSSKEYLPAFQKQPWFILTALNAKKALGEDSAVHLEKIYEHAKSLGFQGAMVQLKTCCAQLSSSHQVIERNVYGAWYLTEKGKQSAQRCSPIDTQMSSEKFAGKAAQALEFHDTLADRCIKTHTDSDVENIDPEAELEPHIRGEKLWSQLTLVVEADLCQDMDQWTLILLLDHREVVSRRNRSILERKLTESGVTCEVRGLHIGDMIWIARRNRGDSVDEFVLNVIVERKEVRDLSGSIIDRRY